MKRELFSAMLGQPTKANCTEVAVKLGKEPSQCYDQWRRVLLPAIYKVRLRDRRTVASGLMLTLLSPLRRGAED